MIGPGEEGTGSSETESGAGEPEPLPGPTRTPVPVVTLTLTAAMLAIWVVGQLAGAEPYDLRWALTRRVEGAADQWRLIGHAFFHADPFHLASNLIGLWLLGPPIERMAGARGLLALFGLGVVAGAIAFALYPGMEGVIGASNGVYAVQGAALVALARGWSALAGGTRIRLLFPLVGIPVLQLALVPLSGTYTVDLPLFQLHFWLESSFIDPATYSMHTAGLVTGIAAALWLVDPRPWQRAVRRPRATAVALLASAAAAAVALVVVDGPVPVAPEDLARCESGDKELCASLVETFRFYCEHGDAQSCHNVGVFVERGYVDPPDPPAAAVHYQRGCDGGNVGSCLNLGLLMAQGLVSVGDDVKARALLDRACLGGLPQGCNALGWLLVEGRGGAQDVARASAMFEHACDAGVAMACRNLGIVTLQSAGEDSKRRAVEIFQRACAAGDQVSCNMVVMHALGGTPEPTR
jgi:membrane associated rhomboid family serine protease